MDELSGNDNKSWWRMPLQLEAVNPDTLKRKLILSIQRWILITALSLFVLSIFAGAYLIFGYTPFRKLLPGDYSQLDVPEMVRLRNAVEEMEEVLEQQDVYITNMQGLLSGQPIDSLQHKNINIMPDIETEVKPVDKIQEEIQMRENVQMEDRLRSLRQTIRGEVRGEAGKNQLTDIMAPLIGPIGKGYDPPVSHYGIDILAPESTAIKSIADGIVIQSDWTVETGNTLMILHTGGIISVYKHNSSLLKRNYEKVTQGEAIAIIGNTGTLSTGPHVHFELWVDGFPVDPTEFINFQ